MKRFLSAVLAVVVCLSFGIEVFAEKANTSENLPKKVELIEVTTNNGTKNNLIWKKTKASGYCIYRANKRNGKYTRIATLSGSSKTKYTDKKVSKGKTYYYKIRAYKILNGKKHFGYYSKAVTAVNFSSLKNKLKNKISAYSGTWSVYLKDLNTKDSLTINNVQQYSASLIKSFAMAAVYDRINKGKLKETKEINSLLKRMITVSDNDGFNLLIRRLDKNNDFINGTKIGNSFLKNNGYSNTVFGSCLRPTNYEYVWFGVRNTTTVKDCGKLLEDIYNGKCVSKKVSEKMLNLLLNQQLTYKIPSGLPKGTKVANKTGETSKVQHDMAIVWSPNSTYTLCIMTTGGSANQISSISKFVYNYLN